MWSLKPRETTRNLNGFGAGNFHCHRFAPVTFIEPISAPILENQLYLQLYELAVTSGPIALTTANRNQGWKAMKRQPKNSVPVNGPGLVSEN